MQDKRPGIPIFVSACSTVTSMASHHFFEMPLAGSHGALWLFPTASLQAGRIRTRPGSTIASPDYSRTGAGLRGWRS